MADGKEMQDLLTRLDKAIVGGRAAVDGFSSQEAATAWGCKQNHATSRIGEMIRAGLVEFAGKRLDVSIDQRRMNTPIYRPVKKRK